MSKRQKRLERMRRNPKNVTFDELRSVLIDNDFSLDRVAGSHHIFKHTKLDRAVSVPFQKPVIKSAYVKLALEAIDEVIQLSEGSDDD